MFDGGQLLAAARYHDMVQWWHGQPVPMAGVASVTVAPEERGRGTGRALMRTLLGLIGDRGYQVSALYPATMALYRSLGWEIAGGLSHLAIPSHSLRSLVAPDATMPGRPPEPRRTARRTEPRLRRCGPARRHRGCSPSIGRVHQALRDCGPNTRDEAAVARWLGDEQRFAYLAAGRVPRLPLAARQRRTPGGTGHGQLGCGHPGYLGRGRLAFLHRSHGPGDRGPRRPGAVADHRPGRAPGRAGRPGCCGCWTRPRPWPARGFPAGVGLTAVLRLADPDRPAHDGWWTLDVGGGKGVAHPGRAEAGR